LNGFLRVVPESWKVSNPGTPTFEQLRVFLAVVDSGSFAGAARRLNRAVSVITYGVANLEAQLGRPALRRSVDARDACRLGNPSPRV
jgi:hypothetical protein